MSKEKTSELVVEEVTSKPLSLGAVLREAREKKQLTVADISGELKLNKVYLVALEEDRLGDLPPATYVRVYLKSIATYLGIEAAPLVELYAKQSGEESVLQNRDGRETITITVQGDQPQNHKAFIAIILVLVFGLMVLINSLNSVEQPIPAPVSEKDSLAVIPDTIGDSARVADSLATIKALADSLDSLKKVADSVVVKSTAPLPVPVVDSTWAFSLVAEKDFTWIEAYSDGKQVKRGHVHKNEKFVVRAKDSVNIKIGKIQNVRIYKDSTLLPTQGQNMVTLKITETGAKPVSSIMWESNFGKSEQKVD